MQLSLGREVDIHRWRFITSSCHIYGKQIVTNSNSFCIPALAEFKVSVFPGSLDILSFQ